MRIVDARRVGRASGLCAGWRFGVRSEPKVNNGLVGFFGCFTPKVGRFRSGVFLSDEAKPIKKTRNT